MPAFELNGRVIARSAAILESLEEAYPNPPLLPADPWSRAEVRSFAQLITSDLHPINNNRIRKYLKEQIGADETAIEHWYHH